MNLAGAKILMVTTRGLQSFGGYALRVRKEIAVLQKLGVSEIDLLVLTSRDIAAEGLYEKFRIRSSFRAHPFDLTKGVRLFRNYDVVHGQNLIASFYSCIATKLCSRKPKVLLDYHGASPEENYCLHQNLFLLKLYKMFERVTLRGCDGLIVVSESFRNYLTHNFSVRRSKIFVLRNFVEDSAFPRSYSSKTALRRLLDLPKDKIIIVYAGGFKRWQGEENIKQIGTFVQQNRDRYYLIVLSHDSIMPIQSENGDESWLLHGSVDRAQVFDFLKAANIGILVRDNNIINHVADPSKLPEYLVSGLHLFASGIGDLGKWMKSWELGTYFQLSDHAGGETVAELLSRLGERVSPHEYNQQSIDVAEQIYTEQAACRTMQACYEHLLGTA